jgi:hypothetical protein
MVNQRVRSVMTLTALIAASVMGIGSQAAQAQDRSLWLSYGQSATVQGYFAAGERIYGSCDGDCYDLDLFLYDAYGQLVYQDTATDAVPVIAAPYEGTFTIEISMPNCAHPSGCAAWVSSDYGF